MVYSFAKEDILSNFKLCLTWEEKYLYIIELGESLPKMPNSLYSSDNLIQGCQSNVWIHLEKNTHDVVRFYGDSNTLITKGFLAIILMFYDGLTVDECIKFDIYYYLKKIALIENLTYSRAEGIHSIIDYIINKLSLLT